MSILDKLIISNVIILVATLLMGLGTTKDRIFKYLAVIFYLAVISFPILLITKVWCL